MGPEAGTTRPGRRSLLAWTLAAIGTGAAVGLVGRRGAAQGTEPIQVVTDLYAALQAVMRVGKTTPFQQRFAQLAPAIDRDFDLAVILQNSVGLRWASLDEPARQTLAALFRDFTIASYTANFDSDSGEKLVVLPQTRPAQADVIVGSSLVPAHGDAVRIDYLVRRSAPGWRIVDVLLDGSISRVAVQRSDFRSLLAGGSPAPLIESLKRKLSELSGGAMRP